MVCGMHKKGGDHSLFSNCVGGDWALIVVGRQDLGIIEDLLYCCAVIGGVGECGAVACSRMHDADCMNACCMFPHCVIGIAVDCIGKFVLLPLVCTAVHTWACGSSSVVG